MVYRYSWLVGSAASILAFSMLNSLLKPTTQGLPWQIVVGGGLVLGVVISWTSAVYRLRTWMTVVVHGLLMFLVVLRIGAPETLRNGIIPTFGPGSDAGFACDLADTTFAVLGCEFGTAFGTIQNGVEPVIPLTGIVIVVTLVFWAMGALLGWGLSTGHPFIGLLPPFVVSLQFATMDRQNTSIIQVTAFVTLALLAILAITRDEETGAGRMYRRTDVVRRRRLLAPASGILGVTAVTSLLMVAVLTPIVPRDGVLEWRNPTGLTGDFYGSISFSPFTTIQQRLVDPQGIPVFSARIEGEAPPSDVYFRLVTMDTYASSGRFFADDPDVTPYDEGRWEFESNEFFGPTREVTTTIRIAGLAQDWLPAAYAPNGVAASDQLLANLQIRPDDASIHLDGGVTGEGLTYAVTSAIPTPDLGALTVNEAGELSTAFANALDVGETLPAPIVPEWKEEPAFIERYTDLPDTDGTNRLASIRSLAEDITANLETDFEKAVALEKWFHSPFTGSGDRTDGFGYTTNIISGQGASDLAAWLLDPDSPNFHQGYCENFATAMGVMARQLGIPSRVVLGFTPGIVSPDDPSTVVVTDANAHAWVELWMPSQGWVRFDPTPRGEGDTPQTFETIEANLGFDLAPYLDIPDVELSPGDVGGNPILPPDDIERPDIQLPLVTPDDPGGFNISLPDWLPQLLWVVAAAAVLFGSIPFVKWFGRRRRLRRLRDGDISAAWEQLVARLTDFKEPPVPTATATEVAETFDRTVVPLAIVYERSLYGPDEGIGDDHVETAVVTLDRTEELMTTRYSRGERIKALYRPGTILPKWWRRRRNGRR